MNTELGTRRALSDEEFVRALGLSGHDATYAAAARRVIAELCGCAALHLHPTDDTQMLRAQMKLDGSENGWDDLRVVLGLEEELGYSLEIKEVPPFFPWRFLFWRRPGPENFGGWVQQLVSQIRLAE